MKFKSLLAKGRVLSLTAFTLLSPALVQASDSFALLRSYYAVDKHLPMDVAIKNDELMEKVRRIAFTFTAYDNQIVPAQMDIPVGVDNPPVIIALHGITQSHQQWWRQDDGPYSFPSKHRAALVKAGFAVMGIDARAHGTRMVATDFPDQSIYLQNKYFDAGRKIISESVMDVSRAIDALKKFDGVNADKVGVMGFSLGAFIGNIAAAVEPRIDAGFIMALPFLPVSEGQTTSFTSPRHYTEGLTQKPMTYLAATRDFLYSRADVETFVADFKQAPKVIWVESEHDLPPETATHSVEFFRKAF